MSDSSPFTHLDEHGEARMVDVSDKDVTRRIARASCLVQLSRDVLEGLDRLPKGDALAVARLAGIQAAKRTSDWIPLAHSLPLDHVGIEFEPSDKGLRIHSTVVATARTGAEMEALVACSAAALAIYDMVKSTARGAVVSDLRLDAKSGGRSGTWIRPR